MPKTSKDRYGLRNYFVGQEKGGTMVLKESYIEYTVLYIKRGGNQTFNNIKRCQCCQLGAAPQSSRQ